MKGIFMDTNVVIDFLADRRPFSLDAAKLFNLAIAGSPRIYISAISYNNIYYILRKSFGDTTTLSLLADLAELADIADVTGTVIRRALNSGFKDYEDAIQYYCALSIPQIGLIVTRDTKDFKKSILSVLTPGEAVALLNNLS
jgi:predicted nucleic acid-binding protein